MSDTQFEEKDTHSRTIFEENQTRTRVHLGSREIILIGTAHVSRDSVDEVKTAIKEEKPDHLCVEIDKSRYKTLTEGQDWSGLKIDQVLKKRQGFLLLANLVLSAFQKKLGKNLGIKPGEEMKAAIDAAEEAELPYTLADREIQVTLRRAWAQSSLWNKMKMLASLLASMFSNEELSEEEIEQLKQKSALQDMMEELAAYLPSVKEVLIDERDHYLAANIFKAEGDKIVAVIGAGHVRGIIEWLYAFEEERADTDLEPISNVPPRSTVTKVLPWIIPAAIIGLIAIGFLRSGWDQGLKMFLYWIVVNGSLSSAGALVALAHPFTIVASFLAAPFTSLNPTIGVGIVTGLLEGYIRRPRVVDFENLQSDILSVRGFFRNRFTHALVVFFLSSIGSAVGTFLAFPFLLSLLS